MPASRQGTISANCLTFFGIRNTIAQISIPAATNDRIAAEPKLLALRDKEWEFRPGRTPRSGCAGRVRPSHRVWGSAGAERTGARRAAGRPARARREPRAAIHL